MQFKKRRTSSPIHMQELSLDSTNEEKLMKKWGFMPVDNYGHLGAFARIYLAVFKKNTMVKR